MPRRRRFGAPLTARARRPVRPHTPTVAARRPGRPRILRALRFVVATWLRFRLGRAPPGYLRLLRLPVENATQNTGANPPAGPAAGGAQSP